MAGVCATALLAPWIARDGGSSILHGPAAIELSSSLQPPSLNHWLGTDILGRDLASRIVHGARISMAVGALTVLFGLILGIPVGALAGYFGGWVDAAVARAIEALLCFPTLLLALILLQAPPDLIRAFPDTVRLAAILALTGWIPIARYVRAEFLKRLDGPIVLSAKAAGAGPLRIMLFHLLPSSLAPVTVTAAFGVGGAIAVESALSFLGLGAPPATPTWGLLLSEARDHLQDAWWLAVFPGLALFVTIQACNMLGEGLREWLAGHRP